MKRIDFICKSRLLRNALYSIGYFFQIGACKCRISTIIGVNKKTTDNQWFVKVPGAGIEPALP